MAGVRRVVDRPVALAELARIDAPLNERAVPDSEEQMSELGSEPDAEPYADVCV